MIFRANIRQSNSLAKHAIYKPSCIKNVMHIYEGCVSQVTLLNLNLWRKDMSIITFNQLV